MALGKRGSVAAAVKSFLMTRSGIRPNAYEISLTTAQLLQIFEHALGLVMMLRIGSLLAIRESPSVAR